MQNIDKVLRQTCENVIDQCACRVLLPWFSSHVVSSPSRTTTATSLSLNSGPGQSSSLSSTPPYLPPRQTEALFRESCTREFHIVLVKMKLYLDFPVGEGEGVDGGTAGIGMMGVLVRHVRGRVVEGYRESLDAVVRQSQRVEEEEESPFMDVSTLGKILDEVVDEVEVGGGWRDC